MFVAVGSQLVWRGGEPGMIHRVAHHLGIADITGNRGNGEFDGHWLALVMKHVGMSKINGLRKKGSLPYICSTSVMSEGISWAKAF
ncbi:uncharacterized protein TNCV_4975701 [Trichonephila clavipes]|uniref:Uncharacterized protein n=1 Tax=Trichonephila clavipes TaxID=2585209 RepID=A0A8X6SIK6_TRICX|nr:uncharacterized protein TNCV_4975701 [Trichonephila clavipes]